MELHVQLDRNSHKTTSEGALCNIGLPFSRANKNLSIDCADVGIWGFVLRLTRTSQEENNGCFVLTGNTPTWPWGGCMCFVSSCFCSPRLTSSLSSWQTNEHMCRFSSRSEAHSECLPWKINYSEAQDQRSPVKSSNLHAFQVHRHVKQSAT